MTDWGSDWVKDTFMIWHSGHISINFLTLYQHKSIYICWFVRTLSRQLISNAFTRSLYSEWTWDECSKCMCTPLWWYTSCASNNLVHLYTVIIPWNFEKTSWTYGSYNLWVCAMVLDGNSELGVHVRSNLYYLIFLRLLIRSSAGTNQMFSSWLNI